ncbi:methionine--tRNA ligase [Nocardiopsis changdeensis]|uniref:Methionine--tRNA ligase n=1 Tax=Nocardiopsis changdeensis TaxID=2831969 RepID=A0ABX8BPD9_9ACTN|nr:MULTISPECIES: methionine--tRNA ligase [Nocardiopsis]QUX23590.1 methionine--tRNA ligase [Nocardiopsis changdeensis]QYX39534.1 methionine--tRNA ligase [Nocardiopsis sp. MT53]
MSSNRHILTAVAWPYTNGPRHIGHVSGFGVPSDVFSRFQRMSGNNVLMVSGTDEHGTPIQVLADQEGVTARELADHYNRVIAEDLVALGLSYDLFTRTTTGNHYSVVQKLFTTLYDNGYVFARTTKGAISPSTGRTLPDRYIEGTCPICGYDGARGDQCDNCGNQLDPIDLISPRSKINGETPEFVDSEHFMLDLPAFAGVLSEWLKGKEGQWRPNVLKFSMNLLDDLQPRAVTRDLDWGVPIPLDGWSDNANKRLYVWFDAVIGYLSASIEWAERTGDPEAWRRWWQGEDPESFYFMGKDNIVFHSVIWPAILLGASGRGDRGGEPGPLGALNVPTEVVSSEFLTMEGRKFSSSRRVVIYVRDFLERYSADALRYYIMAAGPETQDTDFTWAEFVRRNNDELVAAWGNLVNRSISMAAKNLGEIPAAGDLTDEDRRVLEASAAAFGTVGARLERSQFKAALQEAMRTVAEANKYISDQAPWALKKTDPERMATVLHVALQLVQDANTLLTPFLPQSANKVYAMLGGEGTWTGMPRLETGHDTIGGSAEKVDYPVITGDYADNAARWESIPIVPGTPLSRPEPLFAKLDPSVVDEELARLEGGAA